MSGASGQHFKALSVSALPTHGEGGGKAQYCNEDADYVMENSQDGDLCNWEGDYSIEMEEDGDIYGRSGVVFNFKDTLNFQPDSLANLARRLETADKELTILRQSKIVLNSENKFSQKLFKLAHHKIPFPYEWISDIETLDTVTPPSIEHFTSTLGIGSSVNRKEYGDFLQTWNTLREEKFGELMTMRDYLSFYNRFIF